MIWLALDLENRVHLTNIKGKGAELRFLKTFYMQQI
jgi:hypothetical protein